MHSNLNLSFCHIIQTDEVCRRIRKQILRPVKCYYCGKGHQYQAMLDRHINVHHRKETGKAKQQHPCPVDTCPKQYARSDHAYRHAIKAHDWPPGGIKSGSRGNVDGGRK